MNNSRPELRKATELRLGRELFIEHRCAKCHTTRAGAPAISELAIDAPSFEGIGSRRNYAWLVRWIADPKAVLPTARMAKVLHGSKADGDVAAIAAFLASSKQDSVANGT